MRRSVWVCVLMAAVVVAGAASAAPAVKITSYPAFGGWGDATGTCSGCNPAEYRVALYIFIPSAGWWTKPTFAQPTVAIDTNGHWTGAVANGGVDNLATVISAFLVPAAYTPPRAEGVGTLPSAIFSNAVARYDVERTDPAQRQITFSGYQWLVKSSDSAVGPGPNRFSDSTQNVWVDAQGRLHLRITHDQFTGQWHCAEIYSLRSFGYGVYRFYLDSRVDDLDPNIVLGLFTWDDDSAYAYREIDIEFARWGDPYNPGNSQFVVQPSDLPGNIHRFATPPATTSTHSFTWRPDYIAFASVKGHQAVQPAPADVIQSWTYTHQQGIPRRGREKARLNLWLTGGLPPSNAQEREVVVNRFEFVPVVVGSTNRGLRDPIAAAARGLFLFTVWGRVTVQDADSFTLDDGYGAQVRVICTGHALGSGGYAAAMGVLDTTTSPPSLTTSREEIRPLDP